MFLLIRSSFPHRQMFGPGLIGLVSPLLKIIVEQLFKSRYPNMALPSGLSGKKMGGKMWKAKVLNGRNHKKPKGIVKTVDIKTLRPGEKGWVVFLLRSSRDCEFWIVDVVLMSTHQECLTYSQMCRLRSCIIALFNSTERFKQCRLYTEAVWCFQMFGEALEFGVLFMCL